MRSSLLVLAPLRVEQLALGEPDGSSVLRTGMGPDRARIAAARALAHSAPALAIAGLCAGIDPALRAGDALCASELVEEDGTRTPVPGSSLLAAALRRRGLRVHVGPLASSRSILGPAERRARLGVALAVDMESAWLAAGAAGRPLAVVRVVADEAGRHLADPRMAVAGSCALRSLRRVGGALSEWARAVGPRTLLLAGPGSVARAADLVLVAGSDTSSNAKRLVELARREGTRAYLVDDETDIDVGWLAGAATVGISAGDSAPERIVHRLVDALATLGPIEVEERTETPETVRFRLHKEAAKR